MNRKADILLHLVFTLGSYSAISLSLFLEGMQHRQWVQMISEITLVKIYCMSPESSFFFPLLILGSWWIDACIYPRRSCMWLASFRATQQGQLWAPAAVLCHQQQYTESGLCHCRNTRSPEVLPESLKWLGMKIEISFNNNKVGKWQNCLCLFFLCFLTNTE